MKYERLHREQIDDAIGLARHAEAFGIEFNTIRPHQAPAWNRPLDVHTGRAGPTHPDRLEPETLPATRRGTRAQMRVPG